MTQSGQGGRSERESNKPGEQAGYLRTAMHGAGNRLFVVSIAVLSIALLVATVIHIDGCSKQSPTVYDSDSSPVVVIDRHEDSASVNQDSVLVIQISTVEDALQGMVHEVAVTVNRAPFRLEGFNFLFGYDPSGIQFESASLGVLNSDCGWEYFDYRFVFPQRCDTCPRGMMRVVGMADMNNGDIHPDWDCLDSLGVGGPYTLFTLKFRLTNDRTFECSWTPIRFFWSTCNDNLLSCYPDSGASIMKFGASRYVFDDTTLTAFLNNDSTGYPTVTGFQSECPPTQGPRNIPYVQVVDYINGGIRVICADSIDARGDVNLNGNANEIADVVLFSNYFVHGIGVFNVSYQGQVAASDVNANGVPLEVADLVYLIRMITGDANPYPNLTPVPASLTHNRGVLSVNTKAGAAYVVADGNVNPTLLAQQMELSYAYDGHNTHILIYKIERVGFEGDFLALDASIVSVECATYDGTPMILDGTVAPRPALVVSNHPNPFTDTTTISFVLPSPSEFTCTVFDAGGSRIIKFVGSDDARRITIKWDASDQPEGIYVCRVEAAGLVATHRMMLAR